MKKLKKEDAIKINEKAKGFWNEFAAFAVKGNALDLAIGMVIATKGAYEVGMSEEDFSDILLPILQQNNLPTTCDFSAEELYKASLSDKKRSLDTMSVIVPERLGLCKIVKLPVEHLENFIQKGMN